MHQEPLTRLNVVPTFDTATAARTIEALDTKGDRTGSHARQFRILVLDTVTALLGPHLSGISSQGNVLFTTIAPVQPLPVYPTQVSGHHQLTWYAGRTCRYDDVHAPPPFSSAEAWIVHPCVWHSSFASLRRKKPILMGSVALVLPS